MKPNDDVEKANRSARKLQVNVPRAISARYDRKTGRIVIHLSSKLIVSFAPEDAQGLENARPSLSGSGRRPLCARSPRRLSGFENLDGVAVGPDWRPIDEQNQESGVPRKRQTRGKAEESAGALMGWRCPRFGGYLPASWRGSIGLGGNSLIRNARFSSS